MHRNYEKSYCLETHKDKIYTNACENSFLERVTESCMFKSLGHTNSRKDETPCRFPKVMSGKKIVTCANTLGFWFEYLVNILPCHNGGNATKL